MRREQTAFEAVAVPMDGNAHAGGQGLALRGNGSKKWAGSRGGSARYCPPEAYNIRTLPDLLAFSGRGELAIKQLDLLDGLKARDRTRDTGRLYLAGDVDLLKRRCVAIIGTRNASDAGRKRARQLARQLVERGVIVVSGLADGIDTEALTSAIEAGGHVVAVIGTPIDQAYPAKNKRLQEEIYRDHLLVSQFEPGSRVFPQNFPARNRTMAALSDASVIIEASESSGTLHQAAECGRLGRWLGIAKSVVDDPALRWPTKFVGQPRVAVLESTDQILNEIYQQ